MKKGFTIAAIAALALGAAACHKSAGGDTNNVSAEDNMLVPADENAMMTDNSMTSDNMMTENSAASGNDTAGGNAM